MNKAERTARSQVGDGKLPNKYWVCTNYDWLEAIAPGTYDSGIELHKLDHLPKPKTETFGPYDTYKAALKKAEGLVNSEVTEPDGITLGIHGVTIEDRLSGQVFEATYYVTHTKRGIFSHTAIELERRDDTKFTRKEMEKRGEVFA